MSQSSLTSRWPQQLAASTPASGAACTDAPRRANVGYGEARRRARSALSLHGRLLPRPSPLTHLFNLRKSKGRANRGFVLRLCIRKADEAWGEAPLGHGLADTRFCRKR